jgi:hypothetical protein
MIPENQVQGQELLHLVMFGHLHFQSLWAGIDLGVFEALAAHGPLTLGQIAGAAGVALQPAKIVMSNLVALGLVDKQGEAFANGPVARRFLLAAAEDSIVDVMRWQALIVYGSAEDYVRSLRENTNTGVARFPGAGTTLYERLVQRPDLEKVFQDAMARMPSNRFLADALPLAGVTHLCDCGGGAGRNAMALARKHPDLRVTIFDQPSVCAKARENVAANGLGDRIGTHAGNFLSDPFPTGVDAVLYSHIGSIWSHETNVGVFRRAREALPVAGRFFVFNMVPNDDHGGPLSVTTGSVYFHVLATGEGMMHSAPDYDDMLREAGFSKVEIVRGLPVSHAIVIGIR